MNAILLAAGYGSRLGSLVKKTPKCLLKINNKPLLQIWLEKLENIGVQKVLINTHYLSEKVEKFITNFKSTMIIKITYERELLGTAGTLKKNIKFYEGNDGLLIHADNYLCDDLKKFLIFHKQKPKSSLLTMFSFRTENPSSCGIIKTNDFHVLTEYYEKSHEYKGNLANGAIFIFDKKLYFSDILLDEKVSDFCKDIIPKLINKVYVYETKQKFIDIGTPLNLKKAQKF